MSKRIVMVAAVARNRVIGNGPDIPWKIPGEQAEFKRLTTGHTLVIGRTTYESIGRPLPGRTTIVLTRSPTWSADGVLVTHSFFDALSRAALLPGEVVVAGGAQVYAEAMPFASEQIISEVPVSPPGDAFYPEIDPAAWEVVEREPREGYERVTWLRRERM
ncbi:dihydrofolate reductase [Nocardioides sp. URHA0032]|uniref:dihydrofolate reductase n=1 Tax=Nocardioides sp. URHA0032 TaxID=1380388 RepID=UPI00055D69A8|nr:dihydrofolate reductase [Nocardioides sp. URHA0032]